MKTDWELGIQESCSFESYLKGENKTVKIEKEIHLSQRP